MFASWKEIVFSGLVLLIGLGAAFVVSSHAVVIAKGCTTAYAIDMDCDGYGVGTGYVTGTDADDSDPEVNTMASVEKKYGPLTPVSNGNLATFLQAARGYTFNDVYFISTDGNDDTGAKNDASKPFATWGGVKKAEFSGSGTLAGDLVLYRGGEYNDQMGTRYGGMDGEPGTPAIVMSYPGELAIIVFEGGSGNYMFNNEHWIIDTFQFGKADRDYGGAGTDNHFLDDVIFRYCEFIRRPLGCKIHNSRNVMMEYCVTSLSWNSENIYWGTNAYKDFDAENMTIKDSISHSCAYSGGQSGFQYNGIVTNLVVDGSIFHSNGSDGISFLSGVQNSTIKNNLIFNNNMMGIKIGRYSAPFPVEDNDNNLFINNTVWVGSAPNGFGNASPSSSGTCVWLFNNSGSGTFHEGNVFRNNVFHSHGHSTIRAGEYGGTGDPEELTRNTWDHNVFYHNDSGKILFMYPTNYFTFSEFAAMGPSITNNVEDDPEFKDASEAYNLAPHTFNFAVTSQSPAVNFGSSTASPAYDMLDYVRTLSAPDAGCYESPYTQPPMAPGGLRLSPN